MPALGLFVLPRRFDHLVFILEEDAAQSTLRRKFNINEAAYNLFLADTYVEVIKCTSRSAHRNDFMTITVADSG